MPSHEVMVETGMLPTGHPYARIGTGSRVVMSIPGLSFTDVRHIEYPDAGHRGDARFAEDACAFLGTSTSA